MADMNWKHLEETEKHGTGTPMLAPVSYRVERQHAFPLGLVELRKYHWPRAIADTFRATPGMLVLNLALTSRPPRTRVARIGTGGSPTEDAGRLLVMIPGARYRLSAPEGTFRSLHCALDCRSFEDILGGPVDWLALSELGGVLGPGTQIERLMARIGEELAGNGIGKTAAITALADLLTIELARRFRPATPGRPAARGGLAAWRMKLVTERVNADATAPSVTDLASLCGLTARQLGRAFRAETGTTLGQYIDAAAMTRAHRLLTTTPVPIAAIAHALGYASSDSFARAYRRITGALPGEARRRARTAP